MPALSVYITRLRELLHDANGTQWSDDELTNHINRGREQLALDSGCLRSLQTVSLSSGTETYTLSSVTSLGARAFDVLNIIVLWGNQRVPLLWMPWTEFQANMRVWVNFQNMPAVWSNYGLPLGDVYIGPVPNDTYTSYWDIVHLPTNLVDDSTVDQLGLSYFSDTSIYWAAYEAKHKQQSYGEAQIYKQEYDNRLQRTVGQMFTRRMPNPYGYPSRSW